MFIIPYFYAKSRFARRKLLSWYAKKGWKTRNMIWKSSWNKLEQQAPIELRKFCPLCSKIMKFKIKPKSNPARLSNVYIVWECECGYKEKQKIVQVLYGIFEEYQNERRSIL